jgi:hypothetical protein
MFVFLSNNLKNSDSHSFEFIKITSTIKTSFGSFTYRPIKSIILIFWNLVFFIQNFWMVFYCSIPLYFKCKCKGKQILTIRYLFFGIRVLVLLFQNIYFLVISEIKHKCIACLNPLRIYGPRNIRISTYCFVVVSLYQNNCFLFTFNFL